MPNYTFENFEEVENNVIREAPKIVYKYRADWNNQYHKELITEKKLWFAPPRDLNDPYDVRIPLKFAIDEINSPVFFEKIKNTLTRDNQGKAYSERDIQVMCENKIDEIRLSPREYFETKYKELREDSIYDRVGIFSCTINELNQNMWTSYGNNFNGFVVGFHTIELARNLMCAFGAVKYSDVITEYSFTRSNEDDDFETYFLKSLKWEYEQEFRFLTIGNDEFIERHKKYTSDCVAEILIGMNFPKSQQDEFIKTAKSLFGENTKIYMVHANPFQKELNKVLIS
jgi:hypothetical protein